MTTSDEDHELDDPAHRSMRAVWLSMREEEPPAAGLAELLAAARAKAEAMQPKEPWWRRALLAMRRPPVLAFATVIVLLGGAVLVSSQREKLDAMPKLEPRPLEEGRAGAAPTKPALDDGNAAMAPAPELAKDRSAVVADPAPKGYAMGSAAAVAAPDPADGAPAVPERTATAESGPPAGRPAGPAATAPRPAMPTPPPGREPKREIVTALPPPPPPPSAPSPESAGGVPTADSVAEGDMRKNALDQAQAPTMAPKTTRRPPPKQDLQIADDPARSSLSGELQTTGSSQRILSSGADEDRADGKAVRGPTLGQLAKQSETAASRGDCPAVRAIAGRIRKLDAEFHKKHVQANAAVKRCVK